MFSAEKAIFETHSDSHGETSEANCHPHTTPPRTHLLPPKRAIDDNVLIVDWDGPDDPENPRNWSPRRKWGIIVIVSLFTFISPVASSMIAPASQQLAERFDIHNTVVLSMVISIFVLAYAFGPLFLGPLSEVYGRSPVIQLSNLWYIVWNTACGSANSKNELIAFRFLAGLGGSAPLVVCAAVIGDLFDAEHRGKATAVYSLAPLLGPVIGPVAGAWVAEESTWRWAFWSTSIAGAIIQVLGLLLNETYAPILLEHKAATIRKAMDSEKASSAVIRISTDTADKHWKAILNKALIRPFKMFIHEPIVQLLGLYMAFAYGLLYLYITTMPSIFQGVYHDRIGIAGLHYLAFGVGLVGGSQINAMFIDRIYVSLKSRNGGVGKPEFRLPNIIPGTILLPAGLLITGWAAQKRIFWLVTDVGIMLVAAGVTTIFQNIQTYVIDSFTLHAASALAAIAFLRSLAGFGFPLFAPTMYNALGYGKGDTILAIVAIVVGCPAPWLFWFYGERIRNASRFARQGHSESG